MSGQRWRRFAAWFDGIGFYETRAAYIGNTMRLTGHVRGGRLCEGNAVLARLRDDNGGQRLAGRLCAPPRPPSTTTTARTGR